MVKSWKQWLAFGLVLVFVTRAALPGWAENRRNLQALWVVIRFPNWAQWDRLCLAAVWPTAETENRWVLAEIRFDELSSVRYAMTGSWERVVEQFQRQSAESLLGKCSLGNAYWHRGQRAEAVAAWREVPNLAQSYATAALARFDQNPQRALELASTAVAIDEQLPSAHETLCYVQIYGFRQLEAGIASCRRAIELGLADVQDAGFWIAHALDMQGRPVEAAAVLDLYGVGGCLPENIRGNAHLAQGRWDAAIRAYLASIELDRNYIWPYVGLGQAYSNSGQADKAVEAYRQALQLDPNWQPALEGLRRLGALP